jgi:hypothetical protein
MFHRLKGAFPPLRERGISHVQVTRSTWTFMYTFIIINKSMIKCLGDRIQEV